MPTDATGTPTTNYSIPKYNTSIDAPSGLGFNEAMDAIDTVLKTIDDKVASKAGIGIVIAMS